MRKIILTLFLLGLLTLNVDALEACTPSQIAKGQNDLTNVTYTLEFIDRSDLIDDYIVDDFFISFQNIPNGYYAVVETYNGRSHIGSNNSRTSLTGGVYNIEYYSRQCNTIIKSFEFRVPHYGDYCLLDDNCKENIWFDGTYENLASNPEINTGKKTSVELIIILVILILIITVFTVIIVKRRRSLEKDF